MSLMNLVVDPSSTANNNHKPESVKRSPRIESIDPFQALREHLEAIARSGVNEDRVKQLIADSLMTNRLNSYEIRTEHTAYKIEGIAHYKLPLLIAAMSAGVNIALTGSAGTGKTSTAVQACRTMGRGYTIQGISRDTTQSQVLGYMHGKDFIESHLYRCMKQGKVLIVDEFDAGPPSVLLAFNNASDNREITFPNGEHVIAEKGFQLVACMNTRGLGADRQFVGRNRLDASTLDRFCILELDHDYSLEASLIGVRKTQAQIDLLSGGLVDDPNDWLTYVQDYRTHTAPKIPDKIVSMRAVRDGWKLLCSNIGLDHVRKMVLDR